MICSCMHIILFEFHHRRGIAFAMCSTAILSHWFVSSTPPVSSTGCYHILCSRICKPKLWMIHVKMFSMKIMTSFYSSAFDLICMHAESWRNCETASRCASATSSCASWRRRCTDRRSIWRTRRSARSARQPPPTSGAISSTARACLC